MASIRPALNKSALRTMAKKNKKKKSGPVSIHVEIDGTEIAATANKHSADVDRLLVLRGAIEDGTSSRER